MFSFNFKKLGMILSGNEIKKQVDQGNIIIDPFDTSNINPNSYNYRLGEEYMLVPELSFKEIGITGNVKIQSIPIDGLLLLPGKVYLSTTFETIGSCKFVTSLIGRSSVGRLGLFLQLYADLGNLGPAHKWTLELTCVQPIIIYPHMTIGQVSFWMPAGEIKEYQGQYTNFNTPHQAIRNLFFDENIKMQESK